MAEMIPISRIERYPETQPRASPNLSIVSEYAAAMSAGAVFPPVDVYNINDRYVLVDGNHRMEAASRVHLLSISCEIHDGTMRDAILFAVNANAKHGLRRTSKDKRRAVERVLADPEWAKWNDTKIAKICNVGHSLVSKIRNETSFHDGKMPEERIVERGQKTFAMKTTQIGKKRETERSVSEKGLQHQSTAIVTSVDMTPVQAQSSQDLESVQHRPLEAAAEPVLADLPQPALTREQQERIAGEFIKACLSPERTKALDELIEAGNCHSHLAAVEYLIDLELKKSRRGLKCDGIVLF